MEDGDGHIALVARAAQNGRQTHIHGRDARHTDSSPPTATVSDKAATEQRYHLSHDIGQQCDRGKLVGSGRTDGTRLDLTDEHRRERVIAKTTAHRKKVAQRMTTEQQHRRGGKQQGSSNGKHRQQQHLPSNSKSSIGN